MPFADNGKIRIYYETAGSGEPLVFVHGFTFDHRLWSPQVAALAERFQVVTLDFRGHGKSDAPESDYSRDHRITDIRAVVDHLGLERFHLIGLSMGGMSSIGFTVDYPERLLSLVLVSSPVAELRSDRDRDPLARKLDPLTRLAREKGVPAAKERWLAPMLKYFADKPPEQGELVRQMVAEHSGAPWLDPNRGGYENRDDLALLQRLKNPPPTLILVGGLDVKFHEIGRRIHAAIAGSTLEFVPETGHLLNIEKPARFNERLTHWVTNCRAAASA